jgi:hypothetical protein
MDGNKMYIMYIKRTIVTSIVLSAHIVSHAQALPSASAPASALAQKKSWEFGIQALYLNPSYSAAFTQTNDASPPTQGAFTTGPVRLTSNSVTNNIKTHGWGLKLEAAYNFLRGNDLNLNWYSYNHSTNKLLQRDSVLYSFIQDELTSATFFSDVAFSLKTTWNAVNLELGQLVDFTNSTTIRFHGGFQYANIQTTVANAIASYNTANAAGEYLNITNSNTTMKYSGFGPRLGVDLFFNLKQNFTIYGKAASALLVGGNKFNQFISGEYTEGNVFSLSGPLNLTGSGSSTTSHPGD